MGLEKKARQDLKSPWKLFLLSRNDSCLAVPLPIQNFHTLKLAASKTVFGHYRDQQFSLHESIVKYELDFRLANACCNVILIGQFALIAV